MSVERVRGISVRGPRLDLLGWPEVEAAGYAAGFLVAMAFGLWATGRIG